VERSEFYPGDRVCHPKMPEWGVGVVQSAIGARVTVMFEQAGKVLIDASVVSLELLDRDD